MRATIRLLLVALSVLVSSPALAGSWEDCTSTNPDLRLKGCTSVIKEGRRTKNDLSGAYYNRGHAYDSKGEYNRAIGDYDKAIALNPKYADAYGNRGNAYFGKGDYDHAIADYGKVIALNPKDAAAYGNRGFAYGKKGNYDRAIADYDKAIALNPKAANAYYNRGNAYGKKGNYDHAIADYNKAIALDPRDAGAYYNRGLAYSDKSENDKALVNFRQALANFPSDSKLKDEARKRIAELEQKIAAANVQAQSQTAESQPTQPQATKSVGKRVALVIDYSAYEFAPAPYPKPQNTADTQPQAIKSVGKRVALVIGNSAYEFAPELRNPRNDAAAMSRMLSGIGFEVISGTDLNKSGLEAKIREFANAAKTADLSLFFYAGHGLQVAGKTYIVPIDAKVEDETALNFELVNAEVATNYMGGEKKVGIVLLDACRDNPFTRSLKRSLGATRAAFVSQGLAAISSEGGGLVIAYATAPGDVAADGDDINSPFTTALLRRLPTKGIELEVVLKRVKADVIEATRNEQRPWTNSDLSTEVYLQPSN